MVMRMHAQAREREACEYLGPWVIARGVLIGQTCWHPENLKNGRPHLFSKSCEEWGEDCPARRQKAKAKES